MMNFQGAMSMSRMARVSSVVIVLLSMVTIVLSRLKVFTRQERETEKYLNYEFKNTLIRSRHSSSHLSLWTLPPSHSLKCAVVKREFRDWTKLI